MNESGRIKSAFLSTTVLQKFILFSRYSYNVILLAGVWLQFKRNSANESMMISFGLKLLFYKYNLPWFWSLDNAADFGFTNILKISPQAMSYMKFNKRTSVFTSVWSLAALWLFVSPSTFSSLSEANEGSLVTVHDYHTDRIIYHWFYADDHLSVYAGLMVVVIYRRKSITLLVCRSNCLLFSY